MKLNRSYPHRFKIVYLKLGKYSWVCRVMDFFEQTKASFRGTRKEEVGALCCKEKQRLLKESEVAAEKHAKSIKKREAWQTISNTPRRNRLNYFS